MPNSITNDYNKKSILQYRPIRNIYIDNFNHKLQDKNYTIISSFSAGTNIPTEEKNKLYNGNRITNSDYYFKNADSTIQDSNGVEIFPIFSFGDNVGYVSSNDIINHNLTNCHSLFIHNNTIHYIINNDSTVPLVHLELPILYNIEKPQYHVVVTRNDSMFSMYLFNDEFSIFNPHNINKFSTIKDNSIIPVVYFNNMSMLQEKVNYKFDYQHTQIAFGNFYPISFNYTNNNTYILSYMIEYDGDINDISIINIADGQNNYTLYNKLDPQYNGKRIIRYVDSQRSCRFDVAPNNTTILGKLNIYLRFDKIDNIWEGRTDAYIDGGQFLNNNLPIVSTITDSSINFDSFVSDKFNIGYMERIPKNLQLSNKLYKDSLSGNISELNVWKDKSFQIKFESNIDRSAIDYHNIDGTIPLDSTNVLIVENDNTASSIYFNKFEKGGKKYTEQQFDRFSNIINVNNLHINTIEDYKYSINNASSLDIFVQNASSSNVEQYPPNLATNNNSDILFMQESTSSIPFNSNVVLLKFEFELYKYTKSTSMFNDSTSNNFMYKKEEYMWSIDNGFVNYDSSISYADLAINNYIDVTNFEEYKHNIIIDINNYITTLNGVGYKVNKFYITFMKDERYTVQYDVDMIVPDTKKLNMMRTYTVQLHNQTYHNNLYWCTDNRFTDITNCEDIFDSSFEKYGIEITNCYITAKHSPIYIPNDITIIPLYEKNYNASHNTILPPVISAGIRFANYSNEIDTHSISNKMCDIVDIVTDTTIYSTEFDKLNIDDLNALPSKYRIMLRLDKDYILATIDNSTNLTYKKLTDYTITDTDSTNITLVLPESINNRTIFVSFDNINTSSITYNYMRGIYSSVGTLISYTYISNNTLLNSYYENVNTVLYNYIELYHNKYYFYTNNYNYNYIIDNDIVIVDDGESYLRPAPYSGISKFYNINIVYFNLYSLMNLNKINEKIFLR